MNGNGEKVAFLNTEAIKARSDLVPSVGQTPEGHLEIIPGRLYWTALNAPPKNTATHHYFSVDQELVYEPFFADFGPLNLSCTYRYCKLVQALLDDSRLANRRVVHYCSQDPKKRANAAYLICAFQIIVLRRTADVAYRAFANIRPPFLPFRDATTGVCTYQCTVLDCAQGLEYAIAIGWFNWETFDVVSYEHYSMVEHGDMNWVMPDKFLAFVGPSATPIDADGFPAFTPEDFVPVFKDAGVQLVVRLNKKLYDRRRFTDHGIKHVDMYFLDGSCPPREIITKFIHIAENEPGAIGIHCKAGLGRTGTLIGLYSQKHFGFPARAYIGWNRICRPGAILGPQQQFLSEMQHEMFQAGAAHRAQLTNQPHQHPNFVNKNNGNGGGMNYSDDMLKEDVGQGDRLTGAKRSMGGGMGMDMSDNGGGQRGSYGGRPPIRGMFGPQPFHSALSA